MDWALADARFCGTNLGSAHVQELLAVFKETEPVVLAALGALAPTDKVQALLAYIDADPVLSARLKRAAIAVGSETSPAGTPEEHERVGKISVLVYLVIAAGGVRESEYPASVTAATSSPPLGAEPQSVRQDRGSRQAQASVAPDAAAVAASSAAQLAEKARTTKSAHAAAVAKTSAANAAAVAAVAATSAAEAVELAAEEAAAKAEHAEAVAVADAAMASLLAEEAAEREAKAARAAKRKSKKKRASGAGVAATAYRAAAPADATDAAVADADDAAAALAAVHLHETQDPSPTPPPAAAGALSPTPAAAAAPSPVVYQPAVAPAVRMRECCVCLDDVPASDLLLMMPCGHRCICAPCADMLALRPQPDRRCPKCRNPFTGVTRVFEDD